MLAGTDTGVAGVLLGVSSQMELVLLVEAGLTPALALRSATLTPAQVLGRDKDLGSVEPNKLADLVVLDADPLVDIRNIAKSVASSRAAWSTTLLGCSRPRPMSHGDQLVQLTEKLVHP